MKNTKKITKIVLALLFLFAFSQCTKELEYPEKKIVKISMSFDRFINSSSGTNFRTMGNDEFYAGAITKIINTKGDSIKKKSNARSVTEWEHILSPSAVARVKMINVSESDTLKIDSKFNNLDTLSFSLSIGDTYLIDIKYDAHWNDNGLSFDATSGEIVVTNTLTSIPMTTSTRQALILLDREQISTTIPPKFNDGREPSSDGTIPAYLMFETPNFFFVYVDSERELPYHFQYGDIDDKLVSVKFNDFVAETIYLISEVEEGNVNFTWDYGSIFGNVIVVGN